MAAVDRSIVNGLRRGEGQAYELAVNLLLTPLYRFLLRLCRDRSVAEDLTQETFIAVWRGIDSLRQEACFRSWVFGITYRQYLSFRRRNARRPETERLEEDERARNGTDPHAMAEQAEEKQRLWRAVADLPNALREAVCLTQLGGFSYREAARVSGVPVGTIKSRMNAAYRMLRENLLAGEVNEDAVREPGCLR